MKKRLLALALCLVLATSLLPLTAAADFPPDDVMYSWAGGIKNGGTYCGDTYITDASPDGFTLIQVRYYKDNFGLVMSPENGQWKLSAGLGSIKVRVFFRDSNMTEKGIDFNITINADHTWSAWTSAGDEKHSRSCTVLTCGASESAEHTWSDWTINTDGTHSHSCTVPTCGASVTTGHIWGDWRSDGKETHSHSCTVPNCGASESAAHTWGNWRSDGKETHSHSCTAANCGASESAAHTWGNWRSDGKETHSHSCTAANCGASESAAHTWGDWASDGDETHSHSCTAANCGASESAAHTWGDWASDGDETHSHSCTVTTCGASESAAHTWSDWTSDEDGTHSRSCTAENCDASETGSCSDTDRNHKCDIGGESLHTWSFIVTDSTLTATCTPNCTDAPLTLELKADSVTLPDSPFNARLEGLERFKAVFPTVDNEKLVYKYKGSDGWSVVEPTAANAKAGEYQVGIRITGIPMDKEYPPVEYSLADGVNQDGAGYADLYVKYTAVDPKVTAQTGDNRPIELIMVSVLAFSALAAAAFIVDSKRRSHQ